MPQLNPTPWFFIMLLTWLTLTLIIQPKLLHFTSTNTMVNNLSMTTKTPSWNWPWT